MKLLATADIHQSDAVFRQSTAAAVLAFVVLLSAAAAVGFAGWFDALPAPIAAISSAVLLAFAGVSLVTVRRSLMPGNWLMAVGDDRVLVNLHSYLAHTDAVDPSVLEIRREEIAGTAVTRSDVSGYDGAGNRSRDRTMFLDIVLNPAVETSPIAENLRAHRERRARTLTWRHYPVSLQGRSTLRIEWRGKHARVVPSLEEAIRLLTPPGGRLTPRRESIDLGAPAIPPVNCDSAEAVRALAEQGRIIDATLLAARAFGLTQTQARCYVEEIRGNGHAGSNLRTD